MASSLDVSYLFGVADSPEIYTRVRLVIELCEFLDEEGASQADCEAVLHVLLRLSEDPSSVVRRALLARTCTTRNMPEEVALALAGDDEDIACEVLEKFAGFAESTLSGIARIADLPRQIALTQRSGLPSRVAQILIERGDLQVCKRLLANGSIKFDQQAYSAIEEQHGSLTKFEKLLVKRSDLPPLYALRMVDEVSSRIFDHASSRQWMPAQKVRRVVTDAYEQGVVQILARVDFANDSSVIAELMSREKLTPSLLLRAACAGKLDFVEQAVRELSGMPAHMVRSMMYARGSLGFKALYMKTGLPSKLFPLLRVGVDVYSELARSGADWSEREFGRRMIERILTGYEDISETDKGRLLSAFKAYAGENVRELADQVLEDMAMAA